jgi:hypothetical protein
MFTIEHTEGQYCHQYAFQATRNVLMTILQKRRDGSPIREKCRRSGRTTSKTSEKVFKLRLNAIETWKERGNKHHGVLDSEGDTQIFFGSAEGTEPHIVY